MSAVIQRKQELSRIHYARPSITQREIDYATDAAANGWGERCYDYIHRFTGLMKSYLGVPYVIPTSSCTGALHMALAASGVGPGDEVILPDITWIASAAPITYLGATPVFVDVLEDSWCIDPAAVEQAITPKTKAIIVVHLYGNLCDMDAIMAIAAKHSLLVIEDAAEALGSEYKGRKAGSIGDFSTFSFHGTKTVTTGEGGALIVQSPAMYEKLQTLESHGRHPKATKQFWCEEVGFKYKMSNLEAAVGTAQMERVEALVARKREIFTSYARKLESCKGVRLNPQPKDTYNSYWMTTAVFDASLNIVREDLLADMRAANIDARVFFYPLSMMPPFTARHATPVSYALYERAINLPSYHDITEDEIDRVCRVIQHYLEKKRSV